MANERGRVGGVANERGHVGGVANGRGRVGGVANFPHIRRKIQHTPQAPLAGGLLPGAWIAGALLGGASIAGALLAGASIAGALLTGGPIAMTLARRRLVRVPASSANLGPGFDVLAAALALHLELEVCETGAFAVHTDLAVRRDRDNLVVRAFERLHPADGFEFTITSNIPLSGGLGSSAAAVVAGLAAADHLFELDADVLGIAAELEGHLDNVAAALEGGFVVCDHGRAHRFEPPMGLEAVLVVPNEAVHTDRARAALPASVPRDDAVFNVAHASMLMLGLATANWDLIAAGLQDRLHQPQRAHLYPRSVDLLARARGLGALGATISGAGPTVLVWCTYEQTGPLLEALRRETDGWATVLRGRFEPQGADVRSF